MAKKIFLVAGESSGDVLGAKLIKEFKAEFATQNQEVEFIGVGGRLMRKQGLDTLFPMEELSVMGLAEVVPHIPKLLSRIQQTADAIITQKPDLVVTIDSPDFCFRVMKKVSGLYSGKKTHLIAPSVWAYRRGRAKKISKLYDLLLAILPFEPPYFEKHGLKTVFIGHPIIEDAPDFSLKATQNAAFRQEYGIASNDLVISLTPGSRVFEVKKVFPEFIKTINLLAVTKPNIKVIIPTVDKTRNLVAEMAKSLQVKYFLIKPEEKKSALFACDFALAKSGTNTLEFSLYNIPMIIAYKVNFITHFILKRMIKIKFASLVNLIANREIIPEMLQEKCDAKQIYVKLFELMEDKDLAQKQITDSITPLRILGLNAEYRPTAKAVKEILS